MVQQGGVSRPNQDLALSEALQRFHIASCKTALSGAAGARLDFTFLYYYMEARPMMTSIPQWVEWGIINLCMTSFMDNPSNESVLAILI